MSRFSKRLSLFVAAVVLLSTMSFAARNRQREFFEIPLPGIDRIGNLDMVNTGGGIAKGVVNTRNGRFHGVARGFVPNASWRRAIFRNDPTLAKMLEDEIFFETGVNVALSGGVYRVSRWGVAHAVADGRVK
jgi:hypothetical protein